MTSGSGAAGVVDYAALTDAGQVRSRNEDSLLCCPDLNLWAVADGMGGHQRGEVASALALQTLGEQIRLRQSLPQALFAAHQAIVAAGEQEAGSRGMGTTLVAVQLQGASFTLVWSGDSRAYRISARHIEQLSHDHSWVQSMVDAGEMSAEQARSHPRRNVITQCLGQAGSEPEPGLLQGELLPGEILLLCSDGLTGELSDTQILEHCARAATLDALASGLVDAANRSGGKDNISCIVLAAAAAAMPVAEARKRGLFSNLFSLRKRI